MAIEFKVGNKNVEIKFNYRLVFKLNSKLSSEPGADNGAGLVYAKLKSGDESAIHDIVRVASGVTKEDDIIDAVGNKAAEMDESDVSEGLDMLIDAFTEEIENSGFFMRKLKIFKKNVLNSKDQMSKEKDDDKIKSVDALLQTLKDVN